MNLDALHALIRRFEGLRLKVYLCPAGIPTNGFGHTGADVKLGMPPITIEEAEWLMRKDADCAARAALKASPILACDPAKLCAMADFIFNLGAGRYRGSTLRRRVNEGDWDGACEQLSKWVYGGGLKLLGLVLRRAAEAALMRGEGVGE